MDKQGNRKRVVMIKLSQDSLSENIHADKLIYVISFYLREGYYISLDFELVDMVGFDLLKYFFKKILNVIDVPILKKRIKLHGAQPLLATMIKDAIFYGINESINYRKGETFTFDEIQIIYDFDTEKSYDKA